MHTPVLLKAVIEALDIKPGGLYIDATFGEGGHTTEISKEGVKILAIDADFDQVKCQKSNVKSDNSINLVQGNFKDIEEIARKNNFCPVDGILFDLGLSMKQINESKRGFSYRKLDEPLDMRLDAKQGVTAEQVINNYSEQELYEIFTKNSEELNSWSIAQAVAGARRVKRIETVGDFIEILNQAGCKDSRIYSRLFQALRVEVNSEFENLKKGLRGSLKLLKESGRIVIITFHSLEDRIVKKFIRENRLQQLNKKIIKGDRDFKFERSAKLRVIGMSSLRRQGSREII